MTRTRGQSLYPKERNEIMENAISRLVGMSFEQMGQLATSEQISLSDIDELKKRTLIYLKACEKNAVFPSILGLARALGYSRQEIDSWRAKKQGTETARWLNSFADACAEVMHQAALAKHTDFTTTIFLSKALYGMTESSELVLSQKRTEIPNEIDEEALKAEYLAFAKENNLEIPNDTNEREDT